MNTLEEEIIAKFHQLTLEGRRRVLATLQAEMSPAQKRVMEWLKEAEAVSVTLRPDAEGRVPSASDLVNETREERDAELLRSSGLRDSAGDGTE